MTAPAQEGRCERHRVVYVWDGPPTRSRALCPLVVRGEPCGMPLTPAPPDNQRYRFERRRPNEMHVPELVLRELDD